MDGAFPIFILDSYNIYRHDGFVLLIFDESKKLLVKYICMNSCLGGCYPFF